MLPLCSDAIYICCGSDVVLWFSLSLKVGTLITVCVSITGVVRVLLICWWIWLISGLLESLQRWHYRVVEFVEIPHQAISGLTPAYFFKLHMPSLVICSTDFFYLVPTLLWKVLLLATGMCANAVGLWFHNNSLLHGDVFLQETELAFDLLLGYFWVFCSVTSRHLVMSWNGHMQDLGWNNVIHMMCTLKSRVAWSQASAHHIANCF